MEEIIFNGLANYGVLGIWTISLLFERYTTQKKTQAIIENNTTALIKIYEVMTSCQKKK